MTNANDADFVIGHSFVILVSDFVIAAADSV